MKNYMIKIISALAIVLLISCGDDDEPVAPLTKEQHTVNAWLHFVNADYEPAKDDFNSALLIKSDFIDALNGYAWSLMLQDSLPESLARLNAIAEVNRNADTFAALAFLQNAQADYAGSNASIDHVITLDDEWAFFYMTGLTLVDLNLTSAHNYVSLSDFSNALITFRLVQPTFPENTDINTEAGQQALLAAIEELNPGISLAQSKAKR